MRKSLENILNLRKPAPESIKTHELFCYVLQKGFWSFIRGLLSMWRFKKVGARLLVGRSCRFYFSRYIELGKGVHFGPHCSVNGLSQKGFKIGDHVHIREYTWAQATSQLDDLGVGLEIGDHTYIGPYGYLGAGGGLEIGKNVVVGAFVHFLAENHNFDDAEHPIREQGVNRKGIKIGDDVWIGNHVVILDGVQIGAGSIIGAGSVVTKDMPENAVVVGNPAKMLRKRGEKPHVA